MARADLGGQDRAAAALEQRHDACLWIRAVGQVVAGAAERGDVLGGVGHVDDQSVQGHHPQPGIPAAATAARGQHRLGDPVEQGTQRFLTEPLPRLTQRARGRHLPGRVPAAQPLQAADQFAHHLFIGVAEEQAQRHHVVDDHPRRQQSSALLGAASLGQHLIDKIAMDQPGKHRSGRSTTPMSVTSKTVGSTRRISRYFDAPVIWP